MLSHRQKTLLLNIVASPFFLALPITIAIILLLPNPTSKYKITLSHKCMVDKLHAEEYFKDLNHDDIDERITIAPNTINGKACVKISSHDGINYDQWNFPGYYPKYSDHYY